MNDPTIKDVLKELHDLRKALALGSKQALTYKDVGLLMGVNQTTVRRMAKLPGFPKLREFQTDDKGNTVKRFLAKDIYAYMDRQSNQASPQVRRRRTRNTS